MEVQLKTQTGRVPRGNSRTNNTTQGKKRRNRRRRNASRKVQVGKPLTSRATIHALLRPCSQDFLNVSLDAFSTRLRDHLPCIPDLHDVPSYKFYTLYRFTATVGMQGFGFVSISPFDLGSNLSPISFSSAAYNLLTVNGAGAVSITNSQFPWTSATSPTCRVVGCGARIRYSGTELNRGGTIAGVSNATQSFTTTGLTMAGMLSDPLAESKPVDRSWHSIGLRHLQAGQYQYLPAPGDATSYMGIAFTGTAGNTFDAEVITFYEALTSNVGGIFMATPSDSDISGLSRVRDFISKIPYAEYGVFAVRSALNYIARTYTGVNLLTYPQNVSPYTGQRPTVVEL
jgi:hypothetical protein